MIPNGTSYSPKRYDALLERTIAEIRELGRSKGGEYAPGDDRLENFRNTAAKLNMPMEIVWYIYANKHWDAITTYAGDLNAGHERLRTEPIEGRAHDMIVYLTLFLAMCEERRGFHGINPALQE